MVHSDPFQVHSVVPQELVLEELVGSEEVLLLPLEDVLLLPVDIARTFQKVWKGSIGNEKRYRW